jgi:polysaccharide deacetylase 2 family uncharacterized protein YibQ
VKASRLFGVMAAFLLLMAILIGGVSPLYAQSASPSKPLMKLQTKPQIAIIIDDMGERWHYDRRIVALEGAVTCSFFSAGPHTAQLARRAHTKGKEVMLHLPMQAMTPQYTHSAQNGERVGVIEGSEPNFDEESERVELLGDELLYLDLSEAELKRRVQAQLSQIPHVRGVNNHQGSLLTQHPAAMRWVMEALRAHPDPLFFVDSLTVARSVAHQVAKEEGVPAMARDLFLDHDPAIESIAASFEGLVRRAKARGYAVAIGHPYPTTVAFLEETLPQLSEWGVELVSVSQLLQNFSN